MIKDYGFEPYDLPFNQAAHNNKRPIYQVLQAVLSGRQSIFEVGSGTGQHAVYFCRQQQSWLWQPSDVEKHTASCRAWFAKAKLNNINPVKGFTVGQSDVGFLSQYTAVYSANTLHIMAKNLSQNLIVALAENMQTGGHFCCYGPFKVNGEFTTASNADFNDWLVQQGYGGLIDIDDIEAWSQNRLILQHAYAMPANNFLLHFIKQ
ncbi:hypothetical protein C2869_03155 [Saccharobesus litoralis]|uniref:Methylase n=1 Tax=Saccharobesus litoralis TaxID=2172099 RepID=A0A2S0VMT7_9ALTE|nr:DUF938 domain-containing protein [Saccharobesus litoralis]AWB65492.1 hypothetical protein C2869_03155 [Saccharobesus litoralis]